MIKTHDDYRKAVRLAIDSLGSISSILSWLNEDPATFTSGAIRDNHLQSHSYRLGKKALALQELLGNDRCED